MTEKFSSIIIGAGMGGMCAAARLTAAGQRVLVVEKSPYLGGRCSHRTRNECQVTTGAIMIPIAESSAIRQAFDLLDVPMDTVELTGRMRYRLPHGDYDQQESGGGLRGIIGFALEGDEKRTERLFQDFIAAIKDIPGDSYTFRDWLEQHTDNDNVINLFQGFCAALMGTNLHEIPAGEFFRFLAYSSRGSRFGMAVNGNGALMDALAEAIEKRGSRVLRRTACHEIRIENGKATGALVKSRDRGEEFFEGDSEGRSGSGSESEEDGQAISAGADGGQDPGDRSSGFWPLRKRGRRAGRRWPGHDSQVEEGLRGVRRPGSLPQGIFDRHTQAVFGARREDRGLASGESRSRSPTNP